METLYDDSETGCCKRFDPAAWDGRKVALKEKLFVKGRVRSLFHIPLNFGGVMARTMERIKSSGALPKDPLMLVDENSPWGADVFIAVAKEVPSAENVRLSGTFRTKVFEGPYSRAGAWAREMRAYVESKDETPGKLYFFYTTCPKCATFYGKNYVVLFAEIGAPGKQEAAGPAEEGKGEKAGKRAEGPEAHPERLLPSAASGIAPVILD